jgi:hypothetical protein
MILLFKRTFVFGLITSRKPGQIPNHVSMRPVQFTSNGMISQASGVFLHLTNNCTIGRKEVRRRGGAIDEIALK